MIAFLFSSVSFGSCSKGGGCAYISLTNQWLCPLCCLQARVMSETPNPNSSLVLCLPRESALTNGAGFLTKLARTTLVEPAKREPPAPSSILHRKHHLLNGVDVDVDVVLRLRVLLLRLLQVLLRFQLPFPLHRLEHMVS